jgi:hypothetical protein
MLNALRLVDGFEWELFEQRCFEPRDTVIPALLRLAESGLAEPTSQGWKATVKGFDFLNELLLAFLSEPVIHRPQPGGHKMSGLRVNSVKFVNETLVSD